MKKICLFNFPDVTEFHGYHIETFDPYAYFPKRSSWDVLAFLSSGLDGYLHRRALFAGAAGVDRLYRERNPNYMRMVSDFVDRFKNFDAIVMATYNFLHPEVLYQQLSYPTKIMGFVDDPYSTYRRGIPYLWAFDGAFFVSPSYMDDLLFTKAISRWGAIPSTWWPLVPSKLDKPQEADSDFFRKRDVDVVYVGNPTGTKLDRLIQLKRELGDGIRIHGRWRLRGYYGLARALLGKPCYPHRVTSLETSERTALYWRSKIGINMHLSDQASESGNARTYEVPAHGCLLLSDKGCGGGHTEIFMPNEEAIYYDTINEALDLINHYLNHDDERITIASNGYARYWRDYSWERNLLRFLDWVMTVRTNKTHQQE